MRSGIAIIGSQYLAGLREAGGTPSCSRRPSRQFQAIAAGRGLGRQRQAACLKEGETLYANASPLERSLITTAAQRRIKRLTAPT